MGMLVPNTNVLIYQVGHLFQHLLAHNKIIAKLRSKAENLRVQLTNSQCQTFFVIWLGMTKITAQPDTTDTNYELLVDCYGGDDDVHTDLS